MPMFHLIILTLVLNFGTKIIFDFSDQATLEDWYVLDDGVMGGLSQGQMIINEEGYGVYSGFVSLENNGGFSSVRYNTQIEVNPKQYILLKVNGDGKEYQLRVKSGRQQSYSYVATFSTSGDWEEIKIPLNSMYASWRGRKLNLPLFDQSQISELGILIGNKKNESFELMLDKISISG